MKRKKVRLSEQTVRDLKKKGSVGYVFVAKTEVMRMRVSPDQKAAIVADAKALGVSATELLLHLHRVVSPTLRKEAEK
jgi:hypothetical protein